MRLVEDQHGAGAERPEPVAERSGVPATFLEPRNYGTGYADAIAVGDFNGDGRLDAATAGSDIAVYLSNADGSFVAQTPIGVAGASIVTADFNGDGRLDLAVASGYVPGGILILLGNGDGTFRSPVLYPGLVTGIVAGDFNGDGNIDIAAFGQPPGNFNAQVQIFFGSPNGTFQPGPITTLPSGKPLSMVGVDFNRDGKLDLALTLEIFPGGGDVAVLFGNGDGTFAGANVYSVTGLFYWPSLVSTDFNGDDAPDLAFTGYALSGNSTVNVLLNDGAGNFGAALITTVGTTNLNSLAAADLNGDGIPDVLAGSDGMGTVLLGRGDGTFRLGEQFVLGYLSVAVAIADFNGDGVPDVASANNVSGVTPEGQPTFTVVLGASHARFRSARAFNPGVQPGALAVGDFNHDGKLDVAVANYGSSTQGTSSIAVLLGDGDGDLAPAVRYPASKPTAIAVSDVNHDGKLDLVFLEASHVATMLGNGDGTFAKAVTSVCPHCSGVLLVADFNHDGKPDVAAATSSGGVTGGLGILLGNGDGTFRPPVIYGPNALTSVAAADFNHDGNLDLVATFNGGTTGYGVYILMGNGDGTFSAPVPLNSEAIYAITADINRDGNSDIVINLLNSASLGIYLGRGDGTFASPISVNAQMTTPTLLVGDFNGDGIPDLFGPADLNLTMRGFSEILLGGNGSFTVQAPQYLIGGTALAAGDFNGDGKLDVATVGPNDTVWIILNTTLP